jgi:hypothetical protein
MARNNDCQDHQQAPHPPPVMGDLWPASDEKGERERLLQKEKEAIDTDSSYIVGDGSSATQVSGHNSTIAEAEPMLQDDEDRQDEPEAVCPILRMSNNDGFLTSDQEERRRISRSLEWREDER